MTILGLAGIIAMIMILFSPLNRLWKKEQLKRKRAELAQKQRQFVESYLAEKALSGSQLNSSERCLLANEIFLKQQLQMTLCDCYRLLDQFIAEKEPV